MPTFKTIQMTKELAGPPATRLDSNEHNRVHTIYGKYTTAGTETVGDVVWSATLPVGARVLPQSKIEHGATVSGYVEAGDAGDADRFQTETDVTGAGSFYCDRLANLGWEVDSEDNQTWMLTVSSGTFAVDIDFYVALCYIH